MSMADKSLAVFFSEFFIATGINVLPHWFVISRFSFRPLMCCFTFRTGSTWGRLMHLVKVKHLALAKGYTLYLLNMGTLMSRTSFIPRRHSQISIMSKLFNTKQRVSHLVCLLRALSSHRIYGSYSHVHIYLSLVYVNMWHKINFSF